MIRPHAKTTKPEIDSMPAREVVLSYAAADAELAQRLTDALENAGQAVWVDTEDIRYANNWRDGVFPAIEKAPALLFVTSRASIGSKNCLEELNHAETFGKRIIPIIAERVDELPPRLRDTVHRDFVDPQTFDRELSRLIQDITDDPEYVDTHTNLAFRAARWRAEKTGLLDRRELRKAEDWLALAVSKPSIEPRPTQPITDFVSASRKAVGRRRVRAVAVLTVLLVAVAGGYLGVQWWLGIPRSGVKLRLHDGDEVVRRRTAAGIARLRRMLRSTVPNKSSRQRLLIATWNLRQFGLQPRPAEALHYIAEIISHFDVVALQELRSRSRTGSEPETTPDEFERLLTLLGRGWQSLESDVSEAEGGGPGEQLAFVYDSRKVSGTRLIGELRLRKDPEGAGRPLRSPYFVGLRFAGIELAFCNVHIRFGGMNVLHHRVEEVRAISEELARKAERGRDFPGNLVFLGDMQGGSVRGEILEAIEEAGFVLPPHIRELSTAAFSDNRPYDQIALMLKPPSVLDVGPGGVIDFYDSVYTDNEAETYTSQVRQLFGQAPYKRARANLMSDHFPKWLELVVRGK
jgi:hypothetical protein